jgi:fused signal recognition particle receptor
VEIYVIIAVVVVFFFAWLLVAMRAAAAKKDPPVLPGSGPMDTSKPLALEGPERIEVDAPVEIRDDMSLAEVKRLKAARITGEKGRRETAVEATQKSRAAHTEMPTDSEPEEAPVLERRDGEAVSAESTRRAPAAPEALQATLADGLAKTRTSFIERLGGVFHKESLDEETIEELEEVLFTADIGPAVAATILECVQETMGRDDVDADAVWGVVRKHVHDLLSKRESFLDIDAHQPFVILVIGVNGVGKTTTIGKLASSYQRAGKSVLLVAGDTFRAAAVEQLQVWGERTQIPVHCGDAEADPASVIFSGLELGLEKGVDIVICDTAGRLHTKSNLVDELAKIGRVSAKVVPGAPHETMLVLDANTGQNAIQQARTFGSAMKITGVALTKLDGSAKGGVILGISEELDAPIRYIGIGEGVRDLRLFDAGEFVEALFM